LPVLGFGILAAHGSATGSSGCVFSNGAASAFCDTFDAPAGTGNRSGDLNGAVWGTSRLTGNENLPSPADGWATTSLDPCGEGVSAPPHDVQVCNGQLHTSVNDGGSVTTLAMYPKQPFDFAGRTGHIVFDVANDTQGSHAAWPELWVTDQPVPAPFAHEASFQSNPRNGFGIRFAGCTGSCPDGGGFFSVDSAVTVTNYVENDSFAGGGLSVTDLGDVSKSGPGQMNHVEVAVSQGVIDVYATNAFVPGSPVPPLVHIATIPNANLALTRGLVYIEDAHYNGNKFNSQGEHTFVWDNVGFDGPVLPQDRAFDVLDNAGGGLGYSIGSSASLALTTMPVDPASLSNATGALLTFNAYLQTFPVTVHISVNGDQQDLAWPASDPTTFTTKALAVQIPLSALTTGPNTVTFSTDSYEMSVENVDLVLQGGGGLPGATTTAPSTSTTAVAPTTTSAPATTGVPTTGVPTTGVPTTGVPTTSVPTTDASTTTTEPPPVPELLSGTACTVDGMAGTCTGAFVPAG
jgi:hypothetical protein